MSDLPCGGWCKLYRRTRSHPDLPNWQWKGLWTDLILGAAYEPTTVELNGVEIELKRGEFAVVLTTWAEENGATRKELRVILEKLRAKGMITWRPALGKAATIVTICNYDAFQGSAETVEQAAATPEAPPGPSKGPTGIKKDSESPTSYGESDPVVVSRAGAREEAAGAAADGPELRQAIEDFCRDERVAVRGVSPHSARKYVDAVRPGFAAQGQLTAAIRQSLLPDQKNPIGVLLTKQRKFGVGVQAQVERANAPPPAEAMFTATFEQIRDIREDDYHADQPRADLAVAYAPAGGP